MLWSLIKLGKDVRERDWVVKRAFLWGKKIGQELNKERRLSRVDIWGRNGVDVYARAWVAVAGVERVGAERKRAQLRCPGSLGKTVGTESAWVGIWDFIAGDDAKPCSRGVAGWDLHFRIVIVTVLGIDYRGGKTGSQRPVTNLAGISRLPLSTVTCDHLN